QCDCDSDCGHFKKCCPDHSQFCRAEGKRPRPSTFQPHPHGVNPTRSTHHLCRNLTFQARSRSVIEKTQNVEISQLFFGVKKTASRTCGGSPPPIDTVFTRCNCQGNTYFFKGSHYWRFKDGLMDPGFPKAITTGFDGLKGHITAALSVPAYSRRRESVFFFKRGGLVQKYTYDPAKTPTCGAAGPRVRYATLTRQRTARYAGGSNRRRPHPSHQSLGFHSSMSIRLTWGGFPSTVTSAVSIPSRAADGYEYHVFSRSKSLAVYLRHGATSSFFKCPDHSL
uniref:SMB domain-containing protein n=1 Tax=Denticeps clupeoides TaxID=299321 RepID=A0AAY4E9X5_9TELE